MSMFTLTISCLTTSNLPWLTDIEHSRFLCNNALYNIGLYFITSHIHNWALFSLWLYLFILSGVISPLISSRILGTYWCGEFIFLCPIFLPFHTVHGVLKARILKWFAIPSPVDHILSELSTVTHLSWVPLQGMAHSFIELDKAVIHYQFGKFSVTVISILSALWWIRIRGLWKLLDGRDLLCGNLGLALMGGTMLSSVQFMSNSLRPHGLQHTRLPCPTPTPRVYSNSCPLSQWCHPTISSSVVPFSSCL